MNNKDAFIDPPIGETQGSATTTHADLHQNNGNRPTLFSFPASLANGFTLNNIVGGASSTTYAIYQNPEGQKQLHACGNNEFGQLGFGHNNSVPTPQAQSSSPTIESTTVSERKNTHKPG